DGEIEEHLLRVPFHGSQPGFAYGALRIELGGHAAQVDEDVQVVCIGERVDGALEDVRLHDADAGDVQRIADVHVIGHGRREPRLGLGGERWELDAGLLRQVVEQAAGGAGEGDRAGAPAAGELAAVKRGQRLHHL